jgi:hypothetical protein
MDFPKKSSPKHFIDTTREGTEKSTKSQFPTTFCSDFYLKIINVQTYLKRRPRSVKKECINTLFHLFSYIIVLKYYAQRVFSLVEPHQCSSQW